MSAVARQLKSALGKGAAGGSGELKEIGGGVRSSAAGKSAIDAESRRQFEKELFDPAGDHRNLVYEVQGYVPVLRTYGSYDGEVFQPLPSGLGPDADRLIELSPLLSRRLTQVQHDNWMVGRAAPGSVSRVDHAAKKILIDPTLDDPVAVGDLAHWISHVNRPNQHFWGTTRGKYDTTAEEWANNMFEGHLIGEVHACLERCEARAETLSAGGPDIGTDHHLIQSEFEACIRRGTPFQDTSLMLSETLEYQSEYYPHAVARPGVQYGDALWDFYSSVAQNSTERRAPTRNGLPMTGDTGTPYWS
ncbi:hypothetical protein [Nocardia sp. NBC_01327]|uniref:hypothetical protein n=1 Tax=Nocardia sp. NBC_01327 TaxID=2903593 RepID=UPI002E157EA7|nr:hypothetical protein OG326_42080 [Nocardia sp. NBC_01327]